MVDYYVILEVAQTSTTAEIKKAYRRLALKWHPDKNQDNIDEANSKFKEISEAYEVLSDERKRRIYDQYGKDGLINNGEDTSHRHNNQFDFGDFGFYTFRDPEDVFREFFGGSPFAELFGEMHGQSGHGRRRHHHHHHNRHSHPSHSNNALSSAFFSPFGMSLGGRNLMDDFFGGAGGHSGLTAFSTVNSTLSSGGGPHKANIKRTTTSTKFSNGMKITTKQVYENGHKTVMTYENDVLKSKVVDGVPQSLTYPS